MSDISVAVTGPTGAIGRAFIRALEEDDSVTRVVGMARRPFDPAEHGWKKFEYLQGDVTDVDSVTKLVAGADVVVHLAFLILGDADEAKKINVDGSRNVFEATFDAGAERLVYTSSVAAYGFHDDNPSLLDEDVPPRGSPEHYYSAQKAEVEGILHKMMQGWPTDVYVFRPCIVAGPSATELIEEIPYVKIGSKLPKGLRAAVTGLPVLRPVIPDPGTPFQLVHEEDVASALVAAVKGGVVPGAYNLAGDGEITATEIARALGWYAVPVPDLALDATAKIVSRLPYLPAQASWINAVRVPVLMDTSKARRNL
ncbi:MAG TPA: NAD-dependent epimerase/dehydratase family protein, partial [Actinomycetota bacterium]|nr:NAD-dependent epimerase/dehydratase family protein [Actinomycetota bacterium]